MYDAAVAVLVCAVMKTGRRTGARLVMQVIEQAGYDLAM